MIMRKSFDEPSCTRCDFLRHCRAHAANVLCERCECVDFNLFVDSVRLRLCVCVCRCHAIKSCLRWNANAYESMTTTTMILMEIEHTSNLLPPTKYTPKWHDSVFFARYDCSSSWRTRWRRQTKMNRMLAMAQKFHIRWMYMCIGLKCRLSVDAKHTANELNVRHNWPSDTIRRI